MMDRNFVIKIFRNYSPKLDMLNKNAQFHTFMKKYKIRKSFPPQNRFELYDYLQKEIIKEDSIDYLEFGVYRGESILYWAKINQNKNSRFFGFDSFEGLPEDWELNHPKGFFTTNGNIPKTDDSRIQFVKGWFQKVLSEFKKSFIPKNQLVIHIDSDLYSSALFVLTQMNDLMPKDTIIIFDEFADLLNEFSAWQDYTRSYNRSFEIICGWSNYKRICIRLHSHNS